MSALAERAQQYLALRRSLGHKLDEHGRRLPSLVAYLELLSDTLDGDVTWVQRHAGW